MSKKILALIVSALMISGALVGCGDSATTESISNSSVDKAQTQSINTEDSEQSLQVISVPVTIINNTEVDIYELYTSGAGVDEWGNNIIPNGQVLSPGTQLSDIAFTIDKNNLKWDLLAMDSNGDGLEFYGLDLSNCNTSGITITLSYDANTQTGIITAQ